MESFSRANYKSVRAAPAKGLINEPGSNNCFLNSAVQVLWHLDVFRRSFRLLSAHRCTRDSCIFCALKVVFTQFEYSDHAQIAPDQLRKALAACMSYLPDDDQSVASGPSSAGSGGVAQFALGSMADACECLENLLLRLHAHLDYCNPPSSSCLSPHCLTHTKFATRVRESLHCVCGARNPGAEYVQLVYYVATHAILANVRTTSESYGVPDAFGRALRAAAASSELRDCPACKQRAASQVRQLAVAPDVLGVGLVWNSASPSSGTLTTLYEAIGTSLRVHDLFDAPVSPPAHAQPHQLVGLVCYVGRHYATFMFHSRTNTWILFDDSNVKEIGRSWHLVVARCLKCRFVPVLLLYAAAAAPTIDAASVPQSTVQISNAELLRSIELLNAPVPPTPSSVRHERSNSAGSGSGSNAPASSSSLERSRLHKKARPAAFQSRVRAVASVENLQSRARDDSAQADDDAQFGFGQPSVRATLGRMPQHSALLRDSAAHRRQNSLVYALGIADHSPSALLAPQPPQLTAQVLRTRAVAPQRRTDDAVPQSPATVKRYKSLENVLGALSLYDNAQMSDTVDLDVGNPAAPNKVITSAEVVHGLRTPSRGSRRLIQNNGGDESGDSSIESSASSFAHRNRTPNVPQPVWSAKANADTELDPRAIEALGFRQQFNDLLAKADALVREASELENAGNCTNALLRFTQAAICFKQASDLPAVEQSSRLAAVGNHNVCNASVKRLHRKLNQLNGNGDSSLGVSPALSAIAAANRQDSGVSTWSEADPSGHSTASEELFAPRNLHHSASTPQEKMSDSIQIISVANSPEKPYLSQYRPPPSQYAVRHGPTGTLTQADLERTSDRDDPQLSYANTLTQLGPYATLPRKPKAQKADVSSNSNEPLYVHQHAFAQPPVGQVVLAVRSTRRAARNEEIYATYAQLNLGGPEQQPVAVTSPQVKPPEQARAVAAPPPPKPNAAVIRQRLEQLQAKQVTPVSRVGNNPASVQMNESVPNWHPAAPSYGSHYPSQYATRSVYQERPANLANANSSIANGNGNLQNTAATANTNARNSEQTYALRSELTGVMQGQAIVARSTNTNKLNQPFKTPQTVRRTFVLDATTDSAAAFQPTANSHTHAAQAQYSDKQTLGSTQTAQPPPPPPPPLLPPNSQYATRAQLTVAGNSLPQAPASPTKLVDIKPSAAKKKVTFLDDLIAKQAERVRQNMAQLAGGKGSANLSPSPSFSNAPVAVGFRRPMVNPNGEEIFSDSSLSSLNSNSTRQSIPINNRFAYSGNPPTPAYVMSGHDADNETSSSIASSLDVPIAQNTILCKLCQQRSIAYPDSYCSACAVYMSRLIPT